MCLFLKGNRKRVHVLLEMYLNVCETCTCFELKTSYTIGVIGWIFQFAVRRTENSVTGYSFTIHISSV